jgi:hypothetical protein
VVGSYRFKFEVLAPFLQTGRATSRETLLPSN